MSYAPTKANSSMHRLGKSDLRCSLSREISKSVVSNQLSQTSCVHLGVGCKFDPLHCLIYWADRLLLGW
jgi:hypothetical protein